MEWLVVKDGRAAGKRGGSFYLDRLIPPTFSCHRGALSIEALAAMTIIILIQVASNFKENRFSHSLGSKNSLVARNVTLARALHLRPSEIMSQLDLPIIIYYVHTLHIHILIYTCMLPLYKVLPKIELDLMLHSTVIQKHASYFVSLHTFAY